MSETLKMIVCELPRTMGDLNHELLFKDLKQALKETNQLTAERDALKAEMDKLIEVSLYYDLKAECERYRTALEIIRDNSAYAVGIDHQIIAREALEGTIKKVCKVCYGSGFESSECQARYGDNIECTYCNGTGHDL